MNAIRVIEIFESSLISKPRRCGYTTSLIEAVKSTNGTLVVMNIEIAKEINRLEGIKVVSIYENTRARKGPFFYDSEALLAVTGAYNKITSEHIKNNEELRAIIRNLAISNENNRCTINKIKHHPMIGLICKWLGLL